MSLELLVAGILKRQEINQAIGRIPHYKPINIMAKTKTFSVEQLDELAKSLNFQDLVLHYKNLSIVLEDKRKQLTEIKEDSDRKLAQLKEIQ